LGKIEWAGIIIVAMLLLLAAQRYIANKRLASNWRNKDASRISAGRGKLKRKSSDQFRNQGPDKYTHYDRSH
jgi:hypothetical protein